MNVVSCERPGSFPVTREMEEGYILSKTRSRDASAAALVDNFLPEFIVEGRQSRSQDDSRKCHDISYPAKITFSSSDDKKPIPRAEVAPPERL